jgi:hypothetical protein
MPWPPCYALRVNYSPLLHGAGGPFDEVILGAEVILVIALIIMFFRSRTRKPAPPADHSTEHSSNPAGPEPR